MVLHGHDPARVARTRDDLAARTGALVHAVAFDVTDEAAVDAGLRRRTSAGPCVAGTRE